MAAMLALACAPRAGLAQESVLVFEAAQFVLGNSAQPPGDEAPWRPVRLPDNWYFSHPGPAAVGWYRLEFDVPARVLANPTRPRNYAIYLPRNSARNIRFVVNGKAVSGNVGYGDPGTRNWAPPVMFHLGRSTSIPGAMCCTCESRRCPSCVKA